MRILELTTIESRTLRKEGTLSKVKNGVTYTLEWDSQNKECKIISSESNPLKVYNPRTSGDDIRLTFEEAKALEKSVDGIEVERGGEIYTVKKDNTAFIHSVCDIVLVRK